MAGFMGKIVKEQLYGGPFAPKRHTFVAYLSGERIGHGDTKEAAEKNARENVLAALACQGNAPVVTVADDGTIISTREYSPGCVESVYHRRVEGVNSSCMGKCEIDGKRVSIAEYHRHFVSQYNAANAGFDVETVSEVRLP